MNPLAPTIKNPLAEAAKPLQTAANQQMVAYVRRALESQEPEEMERRADELTLVGYEKTARHLRKHATALRARRQAQHASTLHRSPIPEASDGQWTRFVRLMQTGELAAVTPTGQIGLFQTRVKRLQDLGLARDVRRVAGAGGGRWKAAFRAPLTLAKLLSDPLLQYRIFTASMRRYRSEILERHRDALGKEFEGKPATLSGLLAVAHHAGPALASWLANAEDRRRFAKTTAAYNRTTGVY